jgi:hypothetical protein
MEKSEVVAVACEVYCEAVGVVVEVVGMSCVARAIGDSGDDGLACALVVRVELSAGDVL